jgi:hypothetical protein
MLHNHYHSPHSNQENSIILRLVPDKTHAIKKKKQLKFHQLLNMTNEEAQRRKFRSSKDLIKTEKGNELGIRNLP